MGKDWGRGVDNWKGGVQMNHDAALNVAEKWLEKLKPITDRREIAGSLRRRKAEVKDIEIVCIPKFVDEPDLFGMPQKVNALNRFFISHPEIILTKGGDKYKQIVTGEDIKIDLFIVLPPSQWGVQFLLRTGNAQYSKRFVTSRQYGGMMPAYLKCKDGALWKGDVVMHTPEERDVFRLLGLQWIPPEERTG